MSKPRRAHYETNHQTSRALSVYGDGYRCGSRVLHTTYRRARCFIVRIYIYIYRWNWCCPTDADLPDAPRELCMDMYSFVISQIIDLFRISCGASIRSSQLNVPHHSRAYLEIAPHELTFELVPRLKTRGCAYSMLCTRYARERGLCFGF